MIGTLLTSILLQIVGMPDVGGSSAQQPEPSEPIMESYAVTEIIPTKDKKKDKKVCNLMISE